MSDISNLTMQQAIDAVRAVAERMINERDAARIEAAELHEELSRTHGRMNVMLGELADAREQAERDEIVGLLDSYGWWMDNPNMLERLKFALATCQEKSDDLSTIRMAQRGESS